MGRQTPKLLSRVLPGERRCDRPLLAAAGPANPSLASPVAQLRWRQHPTQPSARDSCSIGSGLTCDHADHVTLGKSSSETSLVGDQAPERVKRGHFFAANRWAHVI